MALRKILDDFGCISGLICNYDKTVIVPVGPNNASKKDIAGFSIASHVKLLGMEIRNTLDNIDDIFILLGENI